MQELARTCTNSKITCTISRFFVEMKTDLYSSPHSVELKPFTKAHGAGRFHGPLLSRLGVIVS